MLQRVATDAVFNRVVSNAAFHTVTNPCVTYVLVTMSVNEIIFARRAVILGDANNMP